MQIFINLLQNAIHATDGEEGVECTASPAERSSFVRFSVRDRGCGIEEAHIKRVFDPFFTTRRNGEGTGLGLSVVYGMITKYGGSIEIRSEVGRGTEILFELPAGKDE